MMKRLVPFLCAVFLLAAVAVWAQPGRHGMHGMHGQAGALTKALNLTTAQQAAVKPLRQKLGDTVKPLFDAMREKHQAIKDGLDNNADAATLGQLLIEAHKIGLQVKAAHDEFDREVTSLLTADQAAKYKTLQEMRQSRHRGFPGADPGALPPSS
jgi:Spy/CpxP family protein refolding chaperone